MRYMKEQMHPLIFVALAVLVAIVAVDALVRAARMPKLPPPAKASEPVSTEKIVIDLSKRR